MIKLTYRAYKLLDKIELGYIALALHGFRTTAQFYPSRKIHGELIAYAAEPNQHRNISNVARLSGGVMNPVFVPETKSKTQRLGNLLSFASRAMNREGLSTLRRLCTIVKKVEKREGWVIALNVASLLFTYISFRGAFGIESKVAFTANDFAPAPLAFKAATAAQGMKQLYAMHGQISVASSGNIFPRLNYDAAFLYGQSSLDSYRYNGEPTGCIILTGFAGKSEPLRIISEDIKNIGIALPNYYDDSTQHTIESLGELYSDCRIHVRCHPQMRRRPTFPMHPRVSASTHDSLKSFADECDFVVAGNTGAQIDILKFGCPVVYSDGLDNLGTDDIGLVGANIIPEQKESRFDKVTINSFFDVNWTKKFRYYDAAYLADDNAMNKISSDIAEAYRKLIQ